MSTVEVATASTPQRTACPLCDAGLDPANPNECPRCDWVVGYRAREKRPVATSTDMAAVILSVVPGAGHVYKGHRLLGILLMLGAVFAVFAAGVVATGTMGLGIVLVPLYWAGVMLHAFWLDDARPRVPARK